MPPLFKVFGKKDAKKEFRDKIRSKTGEQENKQDDANKLPPQHVIDEKFEKLLVIIFNKFYFLYKK